MNRSTPDLRLNRRSFLTRGTAWTLGALSAWPGRTAEPPALSTPWRRQTDLLDLRTRFPEPVVIRAVNLVSAGGTRYLRVQSADGGLGVSVDNGRMLPLESLLRQCVIPYFLGQDARKIEELTEGVFLHASNYKYAGLAFWTCVGFVEIAVLDLLARQLHLPVNRLLGRPLRREIPVYLSRFNRDNSARDEVAAVADLLERYQARATKLKIGRRMFTTPAQTRRDLELVRLARETLGPDMTIFVDANGSYQPEEAIAVGRALEAQDVGFLEEPCRWQDFEGTRRVAQALTLPVAGGEQDSSLDQFAWLIREGAVQVVQPDIYYNGGFVRSLRVARLAEQAGLQFTPHSPKTGFGAAANLHLVSVVPNLGPFQEYREADDIVDGRVPVPPGPGLDGRLDLEPIRRAEPL